MSGHTGAYNHGNIHVPAVAGTGIGVVAATQTISVTPNTTVQKSIFSKSGVAVGTRQQLNLIEGTNVTLTVADNAGADRVDVTINAAGGGGSTFTRYESAVGSGCFVVADGPGVTFTKTDSNVVINNPNNALILNVSIALTSLETASAGTLGVTVDYGTVGTGGAVAYAAANPPDFRVFWNDGAGYSIKSGATADLATNAHTIKIKALTSGQALWIKLIF
jgi:hypothetical protein